MSTPTPALKVKANEFEFLIDKATALQADIVKKSNAEFNIIHNGRSANAIILESDVTAKHLKVELDGEVFDIEIKDTLDQMLDSMGFSTASTRHIKEVKAPMPGLVISISVTEGQQVLEGERLLILEAMKMENSIMIHANATIKRIAVKSGQAVEKGQVLIELE
jgi:biotin carboxyl carrier protein